MLTSIHSSAGNSLCPLQLPEVIAHIGLFLTGSDRVNALLVNRTWHAAIEPLLWTSVQLPTAWNIQRLPHRCPSAKTVRRNCHFMRYLVLPESPLLPELIPGCNQLRELELHDLCRGVIPLLYQNAHTLRVLSRLASVHQPQRNVARDWGLFEAIASLAHLEDLRLERLAVHEEESEAFIKTCRQLHALNLTLCVWTLPPLPDQQTSPTDFTNIQQLTLVKNKMTPMQELQFASRCPNVRFMQWKTTRQLSEEQRPLVQGLLQDRLLHLGTLAIAQSSLEDIDIATIIKGLSALVNLHASYTRFGPQSVRAIVEHRSNLQELDIRNCTSTEPLSEIILTHCPDLQTVGCDQHDIRSPRQRPWACKRLQKLHTTIVAVGGWQVSEEDAMEDRIRAHDEMYSQLAELTELTTLELGCASVIPFSDTVVFQLTMAMGLGKLETLTKLEHFTIGGAYSKGLGEEERAWMEKHWPSVEILSSADWVDM
ncbi:hypothetical protein BGZ68_009651 [Mortierella alpina]|nr:hypothetical protein BGZ68_009651 [Mortierella alpina]